MVEQGIRGKEEGRKESGEKEGDDGGIGGAGEKEQC